MDNKPINAVSLLRQAGMRGRYFFLRGFAFFLFVIWSRVLVGMVSMRRASSSSDMAGSSGASLGRRALFMVEVCHGQA